MEKEFKKKGIATFDGMSIGKNRVVTMKFKLSAGELVTSVELLTGLNNDITVIGKLPGRKAKPLGLFTIANISFDKNGNASIPFKGMADSVNFDNIQEVVMSDEDCLQLMFKAVLELPEQEINEKESK